MSGPEAPAIDYRRDFAKQLAITQKYLDYASVFYETFSIREKRGIFWWSLHKLLENRDKPISFKDLRLFLKSVPRNQYSRHKSLDAVVQLEKNSYVSLSNEGPDQSREVATVETITDITQVKLEKRFFALLPQFRMKFAQLIADNQPINVSDIDLYVKMNQFLRGPYSAEWTKFLARAAERGAQLGGATALQIESDLGGYKPYWVTINFLWAQYLRAELGVGNKGLRFDHISHDLNRITYVTRSELRKTLQYLKGDVKLVQLEHVAGRPVYSIAGPFRELLSEFTEAAEDVLSRFLSSLS